MRKRLITSICAAPIVVMALALVSAGPASACDCAIGTDEEAFERADVVFTGRVVDRRDPGMGPGRSSAAFSTLRFEVDAVYKGDAAIDQVVVTEQSGGSCGLEIIGPGPFVVFATRSHWDQEVPEGSAYAGLCGGTRTLAEQPVPASFGTARQRSPSSGRAPATTAPSLHADDDVALVYFVAGVVAITAAVALAIVVTRQRRTRTAV